ncbi:MAG: PP2C family protein-serine/threonine phosphatase, partial [Candidatus Omnitrophota bacterium]
IVLIITLYLAAALIAFWPFRIWVDVFYPVFTVIGVYIVFTMKKYVTEMHKREILEKELDIAKNIQQSFLPSEIPSVGGLDINVKMLTARQVGGDLYDILQLDENRLAVMLGDVSGKGVPAALFMARVVSVFKTYAGKGTGAAEVLAKVNERLVAESGSGLFVTLTYKIFDVRAGTVSFAIGGHMPTLLITPGGKVEFLDTEEGLPIGMIESGFSEKNMEYEPGSIFVLYTDGVTEAMNARGEMFGKDRLESLAKKLNGMPAREVVDAIHKAVSDFAGKAKQYDDITVMAVKVKG